MAHLGAVWGPDGSRQVRCLPWLCNRGNGYTDHGYTHYGSHEDDRDPQGELARAPESEGAVEPDEADGDATHRQSGAQPGEAGLGAFGINARTRPLG